jgi:hypothetical protein
MRRLRDRLKERRLECKGIDLSTHRDDFIEEMETSLVDALVYAICAYIEAGRDDDGRVSKLEREFYCDASFMSYSDDEEAREHLHKQRGIDDHALILFVYDNYKEIEPRLGQFRQAIALCARTLEYHSSFY